MSDMSYYDNLRDTPRVDSAVFIKYDIRDETNKTVSSGISTTRDISVGGVKFFCTTPVRKGFIVKLQLQLDRLTSIAVLGTVAWVKQTKPGQFLLGVEFRNLPEPSRTKIVKFINQNAPQD